MTIQDLINNVELQKDKDRRFSDYLNKDQFERRKLLSKYILQPKNCKIGISVICFEDENFIEDKNKFFYNKIQSRNNKLKHITIGKSYKILEINDGSIKISNNDGSKLWYTMKRFIYSIKLERQEKLKQINDTNKFKI